MKWRVDGWENRYFIRATTPIGVFDTKGLKEDERHQLDTFLDRVHELESVNFLGLSIGSDLLKQTVFQIMRERVCTN
jgi:hypothetical protein